MEPPGPHLRRRPAASGLVHLSGAPFGPFRRASTAAAHLSGAVARVGPVHRASTAAAHLSGAPLGPFRRASTAAATVLAVTSSGDAVLLAVLLGVAALDLAAAAVAVLATVAFAVRWGSTSLDAIAGAQAVLGPAATVGPAAAVAATWCGAAALVVAAPLGWPGVAFGAAAALGAAGPAPGGVADVAVRVGATAAGIVLAVLAGRHLPRRPALAAGLVLAAASLVLAVLA